MAKSIARVVLLFLTVCLISAVASAGSIPVGFISYDVTNPGFAQFDISNQTGPNSSTFPDTTFPVTNSISLTSLSLIVNFVGGGSTTFGSGFFTLEPDGLSYTGPVLPTSEAVSSAILTGDFSPTIFNLNDGSTVTVLAPFSATITDSLGPLMDGDFAIIYANTTATTTPEPGTWMLMASVLGIVLLYGRKRVVEGGAR